MSENSNSFSNNGVDESETSQDGLSPAGALWVSSAGPVVILQLGNVDKANQQSSNGLWRRVCPFRDPGEDSFGTFRNLLLLAPKEVIDQAKYTL